MKIMPFRAHVTGAQAPLQSRFAGKWACQGHPNMLELVKDTVEIELEGRLAVGTHLEKNKTQPTQSLLYVGTGDDDASILTNLKSATGDRKTILAPFKERTISAEFFEMPDQLGKLNFETGEIAG